MPVTAPPPTWYDAMGGAATFSRLTAAFYAGVREDPVLRPLYPEDELDAAEERLRLFLEQYWGGPRTYSETRGHPRLRMRHAPFPIGVAERDAWLARMRSAVDGLGLDPRLEQVLWSYLEGAAHAMLNRVEGAPPRARDGSGLPLRPSPGATGTMGG